jgi:hypothetical protein
LDYIKKNLRNFLKEIYEDNSSLPAFLVAFGDLAWPGR